MRVAARLDRDLTGRRRRQVEGHDGGSAAIEGESRRRHASMTQREEIRKAIGFLGKDDRDRVAARGGFERGVAPARGRLPGDLAVFRSVGDGHPGPGGPCMWVRPRRCPRGGVLVGRRDIRLWDGGPGSTTLALCPAGCGHWVTLAGAACSANDVT